MTARLYATATACLLGGLLGAGCAAAQADALSAERTVYVVRHGWHTGIVFRAADLPADSHLRRAFPQADHVEAGWGDRDFYRAQEPGVVLGLRALLWPTPGALHIVGLSGPPQASFPAARIVELGVAQADLNRMHERVQASFETDADAAPRPLGPGLYGDGRFYASTEDFHAFKTCNVWTAQALRAGGLPLRPAAALTAGLLLRQLEPHAGRRRP